MVGSSVTFSVIDGVEMLRGASDEVRSSRVSNGEGVGTYVVIILFVALI